MSPEQQNQQLLNDIAEGVLGVVGKFQSKADIFTCVSGVACALGCLIAAGDKDALQCHALATSIIAGVVDGSLLNAD